MGRAIVAAVGIAAVLLLAGCSSATSPGPDAGPGAGAGADPSADPSESGAADEALDADNRAALDSLPPAELLPTSAQAGALGSSWSEVVPASALPVWIPPSAGDVDGSVCLQAGAQAAATEYTEAASASFADGSGGGDGTASQATWSLYRFGTDEVAQLYVERLGAAYAACAQESAADANVDPLATFDSTVEGAVASESLLADGTGDRTVAVAHLNLVAVATSQTSTETADRMATLQLELLTTAE